MVFSDTKLHPLIDVSKTTSMPEFLLKLVVLNITDFELSSKTSFEFDISKY